MIPKILIEVRGGQIQNILANTKDIEIFVADFNLTDDDNDLFRYYKSQGDYQVMDENFDKILSAMEAEYDSTK